MEHDTEQQKRKGDEMHPPVVSYHDRVLASYHHRDHDAPYSPSQLPFALPDDSLPLLARSNVSSVDHGLSQSSLSPIARKHISFVDSGICASRSVASSYSSHIMHNDARSIPVLERLAAYAESEGNSEDEGDGICILEEATASPIEEDEESHSYDFQQQMQSSSNTKCTNTQIDLAQTSMYNTIPLDDRAQTSMYNTIPLDDRTSSLHDFEQLLQEADDHDESDSILPQIEGEEGINGEDRIDASIDDSGQNFFLQNLFPFISFASNKRSKPTKSRAPVIPSSLHTPVRATRIRHDKFVVEMDIFPSEANNSRVDIRDVMDILANIELLHLWLDPVPAVFDAAIKDGSGNSIAPEEDGNRQYDGQWVEISTPPLTIPSDSRISGCMRRIRVKSRSMIGFPARIRSMIFVERNSGRVGMTLGPFPDGFLCQEGTMAHHTFSIRMVDEESGNTEDRIRGRYITVSDEVRLQRGTEEGFNERTRSCFISTILRVLLGFLEWALLFRYYQPDLASYMTQTISSMEKLRALIERGESAAYAGGELVMDGDDMGGENANNKIIPLLGDR